MAYGKKNYKNHYDSECYNAIGVVIIKYNHPKGMISLMSKLSKRYGKVEHIASEQCFRCSGLKSICQKGREDYRPFYKETI